LGQRRIRLLAELEEVESQLRPIVQEAVRVEVSQRKISAMTALSTTTIGKWSRE
jgi:Trp operon repressor